MTLLVGFDLCRAALAVTGISAPEQSVLTVLSIMANADAQCWPAINGPAGLTGKTKLSERAVQNATKALAAAGHITRTERVGRGMIYTVHPRTACAPAGDTPPQEVRPAQDAPPQGVRGAGGAPTPAGGAPKQPRTTIPKKATPSRVARERSRKAEFHRLPADWKPRRFGDGSAARGVVDRRGQAWAKAQREDFEAWAANAEDKDGIGRKLDWQAAFAKWINKADREDRSNANGRGNRNSFGGEGDGFSRALRRAAENLGADEHGGMQDDLGLG